MREVARAVTEPDPSQYSFWLASRSAGIVAFILIATAVILGLYMAGGVSKRPGAKRTLVKVHEQVALAALAAIAAHGLLLLGDKWLHPGVTGIAIPFTMSYRPVWTGMGITAGYLAAILGPTFYLRRRIGARRWRLVHRATVVVYVLAVMHSLGSGTDGASLWFQTLVVASAIPIVTLLVIRYGFAGRRRAKVNSRQPAQRPSEAVPGALS